MASKRLLDDFHEDVLEGFVKEIKSIIEEGINENKKVVFLCGADKSDKSSLRYVFSQFLELEPNLELVYPEDLFEDLLEGQGKNSLLALEEHLAEAVDLIAIIPESPGSFAELGVFASQEKLARKTVVFRLSKYKSDRSFINHGPIRLVKKYKGKVYDISNEFDLDSLEEIKGIRSYIMSRLGSKRIKKDYDNFLSYPHQILLLIYIIDGLTLGKIEAVLEKIFNRKFKESDKLATKSALYSLVKRRHIEENESKFTVTSLGYDYINEKYYMIPKITDLRIKAMNIQLAS